MIKTPNEKVRETRISAIKCQIADGTYETPDKIEAAIDAFLSRLEHDRVTPGSDTFLKDRPDRPKRPK